MKKPSFLLALSALSAVSQAVVGYSNLGTYTGSAYASAGATLVGTSTYTTLAADDIGFAAGMGGGTVTGFTFSVANLNAATVSARPLIRFYAANGTSGGPGTFLGGLNFNAISFATGTGTFAYNPGTALFTVPANGLIWAGVVFDNNAGATGATATQLNNLGQGIFNPPTVGSSADLFFQSSTATAATTSSPAGGFFNFGGTPVANFGWAFNVNPVPEPSALAALGLGAFGLLRRRKRA